MGTRTLIACCITAALSLWLAIVAVAEVRVRNEKQVSAKEAEVYSILNLPRASECVPIRLITATGASLPFTVQVAIAKIDEQDSKIAFPPASGSLYKALRFRRFLRVTLSGIKASQEGLVLEAVYNADVSYTRLTQTKALTGEWVLSRVEETNPRIEHVHLPPLKAGTIAIIHCPGFFVEKTTAQMIIHYPDSSISEETRMPGSFRSRSKGNQTERVVTATRSSQNPNGNIESVDLKLSDSQGALLYEGYWPAKPIERTQRSKR